MRGQAIYFVFVFLYFLNCVGCNSKNNNKRTSYNKKKENLKNFDNIVLDDFYSAFDSQDNYESKLKKNEDDIIGQGIFSLISKKNQEKEKSLKGESEDNTKLQVTKVQGAQVDQAVEPLEKSPEDENKEIPTLDSPQNGNPTSYTSNLSTPPLKRMDEVFDDVLKHLNKEDKVVTDENKNKYNEFKKEFDIFTMNVSEYEIMKNLLITFSKKIDENNQIQTKIENIFNKALKDNKYKEQFKNFIYGLYSFAKRHNYLIVNKTNDTTLHKDLFENALNLINTI
ncbi:merozoite surface protein 7 [Plasmodium falciparum IGH-CR14]|uniref:Merozoite surface protein 7 n=1 Tax=Plasmodium falciparum IGH-CR14 TaxID=580059 RepID=A0A0L1IC82_PLAFA|nr:merozoite surface protein 7 [Plasmodium falciparum IGH-CR14]